VTLTSPAPDAPTTAGGHLLEVDNLSVEFRTEYGVVHAVNQVNWHLDKGETLAILGESGSGKSVSAQAIMGIIDTPPGYITEGQIRYNGRDMLTMSDEEQRKLRGPDIAIVFQDALSALNPVFTVGAQIAEMFKVHRGMSKKDGMVRAAELMDRVRIPNAKGRVKDYPHQFSGGMRQRVMMAMALSLDPSVLIADEPTTALDVTVQAQIMDLLMELQQETGMGVVLITHDLGVVGEVADRIAVMYAGRIVETGTVYDVFGDPAHPYTVGLMNSVPRVDQRGQRLSPITGSPPNLANIPSGCPFHPRCPRAQAICSQERPPLRPVVVGRHSACHFSEEVLGV